MVVPFDTHVPTFRENPLPLPSGDQKSHTDDTVAFDLCFNAIFHNGVILQAKVNTSVRLIYSARIVT